MGEVELEGKARGLSEETGFLVKGLGLVMAGDVGGAATGGIGTVLVMVLEAGLGVLGMGPCGLSLGLMPIFGLVAPVFDTRDLCLVQAPLPRAFFEVDGPPELEPTEQELETMVSSS